MTERLLESFREDEAQLDAAADLRIRRRIAELTGTQPDEEGQWPFWSDPVPLEGGKPEGPRRGAGPTQASPSDPSRRLLAVAAAVLVVALVGGALAMQLTRSSEPSNQIGGETVESMADLARQQPDRPLGEGEYLHQRWEELNSSGSQIGAGRNPVEVARWIAVDGTGREMRSELQNKVGGVEYPALDFSYAQPGDISFADLTYAQLRSLPTDPSALQSALSDSLGVPADQTGVMAERLVELLTVEVAPPGVRAAALGALGDLGAEPVGPRTDRTGRSGQGFVVAGEQGATLVIIDPGTTTVLERRLGSPGEAEPSIERATSWRTMLSQEITTSRG